MDGAKGAGGRDGRGTEMFMGRRNIMFIDSGDATRNAERKKEQRERRT